MKIYISSSNVYAARYWDLFLSKKKHEIVSNWHELEVYETGRSLKADDKSEQCENNLKLIRSADRLLLIADHGFGPGGKFVEAGIALGNGIPVIVVGRIENFLMYHPLVTNFTGEPIENKVVEHLAQKVKK